MNKKLLALAVASACVAPSVMAQSANPVTLYARIFVQIESVKNKGGQNGTDSNRTRVSDGSSYLGVRGTEDIGGGNKVFYQLETAFPADANATAFANRNSAVGLQGRWGSVLAGRWDSPYKVLGYGPDIFGDLTIGGITSALHDRGNFDRREQNVMQYWSPTMAGFQVKLSQTANENKTATLNPSNFAGSLKWGKGPVTLAYGYEKHKDVSTSIRKEEGNEFTGEFKWGHFKFAGIYEEIKKDNTDKQKNWLASVIYSMGKHDFAYQYQQSKDGGPSNSTAQSPDCDVNTLAYFYNASKRTQFQVQYTKIDNNQTSVCKFGAGGFAASDSKNADPEGFAIGIRHVF